MEKLAVSAIEEHIRAIPEIEAEIQTIKSITCAHLHDELCICKPCEKLYMLRWKLNKLTRRLAEAQAQFLDTANLDTRYWVRGINEAKDDYNLHCTDEWVEVQAILQGYIPVTENELHVIDWEENGPVITYLRIDGKWIKPEQ